MAKIRVSKEMYKQMRSATRKSNLTQSFMNGTMLNRKKRLAKARKGTGPGTSGKSSG